MASWEDLAVADIVDGIRIAAHRGEELDAEALGRAALLLERLVLSGRVAPCEALAALRSRLFPEGVSRA